MTMTSTPCSRRAARTWPARPTISPAAPPGTESSACCLSPPRRRTRFRACRPWRCRRGSRRSAKPASSASARSACLATISTLSCDTPRTPFVMPMDRRNFDLGSGAMSSKELPLPSSLGGGIARVFGEISREGIPAGSRPRLTERCRLWEWRRLHPVRTCSLRDLAFETGVVRTLTHRSRRLVERT